METDCWMTHSVWVCLMECCCGEPTGVCVEAAAGEAVNAKAVAGTNGPLVSPRKRLNLRDKKGSEQEVHVLYKVILTLTCSKHSPFLQLGCALLY